MSERRMRELANSVFRSLDALKKYLIYLIHSHFVIMTDIPLL